MRGESRVARIVGRRGRFVFPTLSELGAGRVHCHNLERMTSLGRAVLRGNLDWRDPQVVADLIAKETEIRRLF